MSPVARFEKYEGLGNDFVVVDAEDGATVGAAVARAFCDRRRGIGADGVLEMLPPRAGGSARMRVWNADGSIAEMCGNGLRCAALHLARARGMVRGELAVETDAGLRACAVERSGDSAVVFCEMGTARVEGDVVVDVEGESFTLTRVDVGNPHVVGFSDANGREFSRERFERVGPRLSGALAFARTGGVNVELARMDGGVLDVLVWERGAGPTLACGTGACAAVAAAHAKGLVSGEGPLRVRLPGGELEIHYDAATGRAAMRGPARRVFSGTLPRGDT
jgi:diaminopimelate epimerase